MKLIAKFCLPEVVAMETVTHSFFSMTDISAGGEDTVLKFWQCVLLKQRYILCSEQNFLRLSDIIKQTFRQGPLDVMAYFTIGHSFDFFA